MNGAMIANDMFRDLDTYFLEVFKTFNVKETVRASAKMRDTAFINVIIIDTCHCESFIQ